MNVPTHFLIDRLLKLFETTIPSYAVRENRRCNREWTIQRHWQEELEDTKRLSKSANRRRTDNTMPGQKKKDKETNSDLQNTTQKTKATRIPPKDWG